MQMDPIRECVDCGHNFVVYKGCKECGKKEKIIAEFKELVDHPVTGLKESSNSNKARYGLYSLLDEAFEHGITSNPK